jgi:catalase
VAVGAWLSAGVMLAGANGREISVKPPADKDLAQQIFHTMVQVPGNKPGDRPVHAKGIVCQGTFAPPGDAATLSKAAHFQGTSIPVTVRFSDGPPAPSISDNASGAGE